MNKLTRHQVPARPSLGVRASSTTALKVGLPRRSPPNLNKMTNHSSLTSNRWPSSRAPHLRLSGLPVLLARQALIAQVRSRSRSPREPYPPSRRRRPQPPRVPLPTPPQPTRKSRTSRPNSGSWNGNGPRTGRGCLPSTRSRPSGTVSKGSSRPCRQNSSHSNRSWPTLNDNSRRPRLGSRT